MRVSEDSGRVNADNRAFTSSDGRVRDGLFILVGVMKK